MFAVRLQEEVDAAPDLARAALQMSQEHAPEMWLISIHSDVSFWGSAIASSDCVTSMAFAIDWSRRGHLWRTRPASLGELVEAMP
jgi:hypothetical protein